MIEDPPFAELLGSIVRQSPDRIAVTDDAVELTYEELDSMSNRVAHAILERTRTTSQPVGIVLGHGSTPVIAMIGALKSGRPFVPLDAREPVERLRRLRDASGITLTITDREHHAMAIGLAAPAQIVFEDLERADSVDPGLALDPASPAAVFFTSGSTGEPKGVVHSLANQVHTGRFLATSHELTPSDRLGLTASFAFGASSVRILGALFSGATLCCYDVHRHGVRGLDRWVNARSITALSLVPSVLRAVCEQEPGPPMASVRLVLSGGEALRGQDVLRARSRFGPRTVFCNRLSSTETYVVTEHFVGPADRVDDGPLPCGTTVAGVEVRILEADGTRTPDGDAGELVVVGRHLALGYWDDPALTAARFFEEPDGRRGFRTSDLIRLRPDGLLEHAGRSDSRVKVHGAMVSTEEVEVALRTRGDVLDVAVVAGNDGGGGSALTAYVVPERSEPPSERELRRDLGSRLPAHLVPSAFVLLVELPRTDRGKLDRSALPPATPARPPFRATRTLHEQALAEAFEEILRVEPVGLDDDFFELGGDSLAAVELLAAIQERFGVSETLTAILEGSTVEALARRLADQRDTPASDVLALRTGTKGPPFFCASGIGNPVLGLRRLASRSDSSRSWYGMQMRGIEEHARPDRNMTSVARRLVAEVRAIQPTGPYLLGGHSSGALVAFEMACQLRAVGEEIALLVIIDGHAPRARTARLTKRLDLVRTDRPGRRVGVGSTATRAIRWVAASVAARARFRVQMRTAGFTLRDQARRYEVFTFLGRWIARRYRPRATFDGHSIVLHCRDTTTVPDSWASYLTGRVDLVGVGGDHRSMLRDPFAAGLAVEIDRALADLSTAR